jgi:hypothetical protein
MGKYLKKSCSYEQSERLFKFLSKYVAGFKIQNGDTDWGWIINEIRE